MVYLKKLLLDEKKEMKNGQTDGPKQQRGKKAIESNQIVISTNTSTLISNTHKTMTNNNLIASLLRDDKSKMATLIACGASAVALIYYNREVRNQIANIFMVRFLLLLFVAVVFRWSSFIIIIIIIIIISLMMMMMVMTMPLLVCERETTRLIFREC